MLTAAPAWAAAADGIATASLTRTGIVMAESHKKHAAPAGFPENAARIDAIEARLVKNGLMSRAVRIAGTPADDRWLKLVHTDGYIKRLRAACAAEKEFIDTHDVPLAKGSEEAARAAVGDVLAAVDAVMAGKVRNAFCAVRPLLSERASPPAKMRTDATRSVRTKVSISGLTMKAVYRVSPGSA